MNEITCNVCHQDFEREAPEGVTLQPTHDFICDECQNKHNDASGATEAEALRVTAERKAAEAASQVVTGSIDVDESAEQAAQDVPAQF